MSGGKTPYILEQSAIGDKYPYPWAILIEMSRYRDITLKEEVHVESEASRTINYVVKDHKAADFLSCVGLQAG